VAWLASMLSRGWVAPLPGSRALRATSAGQLPLVNGLARDVA
jgi:hypothetical protein